MDVEKNQVEILKEQILYVELKCQLDATDDIYCRSYCMLNTFRAILCPSSGAREFYTDGRCLWYLVLWFSGCRCDVELKVMCPVCRLLLAATDNLKTKAPNTTGSHHLYNTLELLIMGIELPETCWACNKICNKYHLLHLVGILFPHNNDDARSKLLQTRVSSYPALSLVTLITSTPTFLVSVYKLKEFSLFTLLIKSRRRLTGTYTAVNYRHLVRVSHVCDITNKWTNLVGAVVHFRRDPGEERERPYLAVCKLNFNKLAVAGRQMNSFWCR